MSFFRCLSFMRERKEMNMELRNLKGSTDFMPQEQKVRQEIIRKLQMVFERYGYLPLETPTLCYFDVLASKYAGGAEILKEAYRLSDQGGRELGLRYDLTVPFSRVVGMNPEIRMPFKRYEIGKVYRDGPVKTGRNREFIQCDVDVVGIKSVMAEAELLVMAVEVYKLLGLDVYISFNNRKLLSGIIESVGIEPALSTSVILCLDKFEKIGNDGVKLELLQLGIETSKVNTLLCCMEAQPEALLSALTSGKTNALLEQGIQELNCLREYADALGISNALRFSPGLARGLEIYTGSVWEVLLTDGSISSSVGAGGRYDSIIGGFIDNGSDYPAAGMTFGLDVIYQALLLKGAVNNNPPVDLYVIPLGTEKMSLQFVTDLRRKGIKVDIEMMGRRLKKSLDFANKQGIPYVLILGENEVRTGKVMVKNLLKGCEYEVNLCEFEELFRKMMEG